MFTVKLLKCATSGNRTTRFIIFILIAFCMVNILTAPPTIIIYGILGYLLLVPKRNTWAFLYNKLILPNIPWYKLIKHKDENIQNVIARKDIRTLKDVDINGVHIIEAFITDVEFISIHYSYIENYGYDGEQMYEEIAEIDPAGLLSYNVTIRKRSSNSIIVKKKVHIWEDINKFHEGVWTDKMLNVVMEYISHKKKKKVSKAESN